MDSIINIIKEISQFFYRIHFKPKLELDFDLYNPSLYDDITFSCGSILKPGIALKLDVYNKGKKEADDVQITLSKVSCNDKSLPIARLKLYWSYQDEKVKSHIPRETKKSIPSRTHEHCDFIHILKDANNSYIENAFFVTEVNQNNILKISGLYEVEITVCGKNIKTFSKKLRFYYNNNEIEKEKIIIPIPTRGFY